VKSNAAVKFQSLPIADENQKIEVILNENGQVAIKLSTWTEGLGWCSQKTLNFDGSMLADLHRALSAARVKYDGRRETGSNSQISAKILTFPIAA
jgi:hypothetical protein